MDPSLLLLPTDEEHATLEAALAFLDGFESDAETDATEILQLRKQLEQLTAQLSGLQERCSQERRALESRVRPDDRTGIEHSDRRDASPSSLLPLTHLHSAGKGGKGGPIELRRAMLEYRRLQEAKALNLRLKVDWRRQLELVKAMEATFELQFASVDFELLMKARRERLHFGFEDSPTRSRDLSKQFTEHDAFVEAMYCQAAVVIAYINLQDTSRVFSSSRTYEDHPCGEMLEFVINTPLACSLEQVEAHMWSFAAHRSAKNPPTREELELAASHQHNYTLRLDCKFGAIQVEGESIVRKFTEPRRTVHVVVSRLALEETDLRFRETAWMIMDERTGEDGAPVLVVQMCYRVYPELAPTDSSGGSGELDETTAYFQNFIMSARGATQRTLQFANLIEYLDAMYRNTTTLTARFSQCSNTPMSMDSRNMLAKDKTFGHVEIILEKAHDGRNRRVIVFASVLVLAGSDLVSHEEATLALHAANNSAGRRRMRADQLLLLGAMVDKFGSPAPHQRDEQNPKHSEGQMSSFALFAHDDSSDDADMLEAALAFLDDWETSASAPSSSSEDSTASPPLHTDWRVDGDVAPANALSTHDVLAIARSVQHQHQQRQSAKLRRGKPKAPPRSKKTEILELRDQVTRLKARLALLQLHEPPSASARPGALRRTLLLPSASSAVPALESELQKLRQAEALNRTLRTALQKQAGLGKRLMTVFSKQPATIPDLSVLVDTASRYAQSAGGARPFFPDPFASSDDAFMFAELFGSLERSRAHIAAVTTGLHRHEPGRAASSSHVHVDPLVGSVVEFSTSTPLGCSLQALDAFTWGHLSSTFTDKDGKEAFTKKLLPQSGRIEMRFTVMFDCELGALAVEGRTAMRRIEEPDRVLVVYTALLIPSGLSGLLFRQSGCIVMSKTTSDSDSEPLAAATSSSASDDVREGSLLQSYYRLHAEMACDEHAPDHERLRLEYVQDFVRTAQAEQMRAYQLLLQQTMLRELSAPSLVGGAEPSARASDSAPSSGSSALPTSTAMSPVDCW
ncbi:hypothetical protein PybrP1_010714 [[Pythium] brassicae (nom. inval.)]|nr:hypothetical protein PybrP1_010714 [[Pythium] brassicae (nom. inval.)]